MQDLTQTKRRLFPRPSLDSYLQSRRNLEHQQMIGILQEITAQSRPSARPHTGLQAFEKTKRDPKRAPRSRSIQPRKRPLPSDFGGQAERSVLGFLEDGLG